MRYIDNIENKLQKRLAYQLVESILYEMNTFVEKVKTAFGSGDGEWKLFSFQKFSEKVVEKEKRLIKTFSNTNDGKNYTKMIEKTLIKAFST
ncbi:hypothetical protein [Brevibacillus choshinensis]|uniref:Uncharacterized protein n=1 Tax=Brevibacillus choshinensis TaxID=54911 RepID=A0ABX7FIJ0_BRECH|nr:hypothetical protein [Brevibacillus choshinensis]QRG65957.1 hypothetical protein JNE38_20580 [Brevibacillus choshinensis]